MIAFLGTGLLGTGFVKALLAKGEQVKVWNRTKEKTVALEKAGAVIAPDPAEAVAGLTRIHLVLADDASVDGVLEQAAPRLEAGAVIIDHTTTSVEGARKRTEAWASRGITYVHVPVFMGPSNALEGSGVMLLGGKEEICRQVEPWLNTMTGKIIRLGDDPGRAAAVKLLGNMFLITLTGGFSDMLAMAAAMQVPADAISQLFAEWNAGAMAPARFKRVASAPYDDPSWELKMARKDARLMMEEAAKGGKELVVIPAIAAIMDQWIGKGFGNKDWTVIAADHIQS